MGLRLRSNEARRPSARKPSGRRLLSLPPALARLKNKSLAAAPLVIFRQALEAPESRQPPLRSQARSRPTGVGPPSVTLLARHLAETTQRKTIPTRIARPLTRRSADFRPPQVDSRFGGHWRARCPHSNHLSLFVSIRG